MRLYLVRHGAVFPDGAEKICLGRMDLPLTESGRRQAAALRPYFEAHPVAELWSSPLLRCRETAALLAPGRTAAVCGGLIETDVGELDGLPFQEIRRRWPEEWARNIADPLRFVPPGGEPFGDALARFAAALRGIALGAAGDAAAVAHAGVNRLFLCAVQGWDAPRMYTIPQPYGCVNVLDFDGERFRVLETAVIP